MFLFKSVYNLFNPSINQLKNENELKAVNDEINRQIELEENTINFYHKEPTKKSINKNEQKTNCFKKTGIISKLDSDYGIIDGVHIFNIERVASDIANLKIGCSVEYLAYMPEGYDTNLKINKILSIVSWDEPIQAEIKKEIDDLDTEYFETHQQNKMGIVTERTEHYLNVYTDTDIWIDYKNLSLEFVPEEGDRIILHCIVQTDDNFVDSCGKILEYTSITPIVKKNHCGFITKIDENWCGGVVDSNYFFMFEVLDMGYKPNKGDKVNVEIIENNRYEEFTWRCIKVSLIQEMQSLPQNIIENEDINNLNKNGIVMTANLRFNFTELLETDVKELIVKNENEHRHKILRCCIKMDKKNSQLTLLEPNMNEQFFLQPGQQITYKFRAKANFYGLSSEIFEITFGGSFKISRKIEIDVGDASNAKYKINKNIGGNSNRRGANNYYRNVYNASLVWSNLNKRNIVPGVSVNLKPKFVKIRIGQFDIPQRLRTAFLNAPDRTNFKDNIESIFPCMTEDLSYDNYTQRFQTLLHIEEIEQFVQFRKYDQDRAHFSKEGEFLRLDIENLAEKRPSLMIGDSIYAKNPWTNSDSEENQQSYQGFIHKVLHNRILVKFNHSFHEKYKSEDYKLEFFFSRFGFRKQHFAVQKVPNYLGENVLFPTKFVENTVLLCDVDLDDDFNLISNNDGKKIAWYNQSLNHVQKQAVKNILRGEAKLMPYVIFGPPGTGKTITLIETILQIVQNCPSARLLIGTPSNSSADLIATRLIESKVLLPGDFIRLVGQNVIERELIPEHLKQYCGTIDISIEGTTINEMLTTDSGLKLRCQKHHLGQHRITIGTCITLGTLIQLDFNKDHFTHVLIDEAGQCTEPEIMVLLSQVDNKKGQIILAGDPLQLGPIVINHYTNEKGLEVSYLMRLLNRTPYSKDKLRENYGYNCKLVTKLIYNYRSLPSILKPYNDCFYNSELQPCIDAETSVESKMLEKVFSCLPINENRDKNHGTFFYGVRGENRQDSNSPSWYNAEEARQLFLLVIKLYRLGVEPDNIGIITPYQLQVKKIKNLFKTGQDLKSPKIGSVEEFQGQERNIILISTVRSAKTLLQIDLKYALGFVQNKKRMNVAISRARALLIVFGNPHLLSLDNNWEKLIRYCVENNSYTGCDLPQNLQNI